MNVPSREECFQILRDARVPAHIVAHSIQVSLVATLLVDMLKERGINLDRALVQAAALLHDITKSESLQTRENHALTGAKLVGGLGYPEVGAIVGQHVRLDAYFASETPVEAEVVNYADKIVMHDRVVSMRERMEDILRRYARTSEIRERIELLIEKSIELENRLFGFLSITPGRLPALLRRDEFDEYLAAYKDYAGLSI
jgi:uncharacterized protein